MRKEIPVWPFCHFKEMTLHTSCSDMSGNSDGFECDYCGHTISLPDWIKRRERLVAAQEGTDD